VKEKFNITNKLYLGIFLILWSINGYFIGGNILKYTILLSGLAFLYHYYVNSKLKKDSIWFVITIFSISYFSILLLKAFLQNQNTTNITIIIFGAINVLLFCVGVLISRNIFLFTIPSKKVILFIFLLTFLGVIFYFLSQSIILNQSASIKRSSGGEEDGINVIGIAYTNALIFIILFVISKMVKGQSKLYYYISIILMLCTIFVIVQTQSRGALIYLFLIFLISSISKLNYKILASQIMKVLALIIFSGVLVFTAIKVSPTLERSYEGLSRRMEDLMGSVQGTSQDRSTEEREEKYDDFFLNYDKYFFFGQENYSPYPHNIFIELIQRFGIILSVPILFLLASSLRKSLKVVLNRNPHLLYFFFSMVFLFAFFQSLSSMSLEMNRTLWLSMGVMYGIRNP